MAQRTATELLHAQHGGGFNHIHLSATWMALGRLQTKSARGPSSKKGYTRFRPMPERVIAELHPLMSQTARAAAAGELAGRELANVCYGVARSRIPDGPARAELLEVLAAAAAARVRDLKPQELSNTAWAYSTAGHAAPRLHEPSVIIVLTSCL